MTALIPRVLPRTLPDVRTRLTSELETKGIPNAHWPINTGNDCLALLTWAAGIRTRDDLSNALISIGAFRAVAGWTTIQGHTEIRAGDWPLWDWDGDGSVDHIEFAYSADHVHDELTTISANTGPHPGVEAPRGVWQKTRPLTSESLWGALRPVYLDPPSTAAERKQVAAAATYLNRTMPATYHDTATGRTLVLHRSGAGDIGKAKGDGKRGPAYRLLVQTWGRMSKRYGVTYKLDGVFGPHSDHVEEQLFAVVKTAR